MMNYLNSRILDLHEAEKMLDVICKRVRCEAGECNSCGCGKIHGLSYLCRMHYLLMK